ncbi:trypsin-like peptidase domain-containing protein [Inquilinus limosus]|uniref:phospholipase D-like domain-containing protein n=1 Tax=Inquilinus limosus TaxID=171674 RepID=UPI003F138867
MAGEDSYLSLLQRKVRQIQSRSPGIEGMPATEMMPGGDPAAPRGPNTEAASLEAVIRWYRPVLAVVDDRFAQAEGGKRLEDPNMAASRALLEALERNRARLDPAIRSVGRIELLNNGHYPWVGTGWIIGSELGDDIVVTNAHVAREFAMQGPAGFRFRPGIPDIAILQAATVDFREELGSASAREFPITEVIWISETPGQDVAFLRVARRAGEDRIDPPIRLLTEEIADGRMVAVIGFPGSGNGYDPEPFRKLFGPVLGKKRFSPGLYDGSRNGSITHDCSTLPGSSGSVVIDVASGRAVGLHFAGTAFETNYAVSAADLAKIIRHRPWQPEAPARKPAAALGDAGSAGAASSDGGRLIRSADGALTFSVPLEITIRLGVPSAAAGGGTAATPPRPRTDRAAAEAAAERVRRHLVPGAALSVGAGYLFRDGVITDDFGVIVGVAPGASLDPADYGLGTHVDGVEIAVEIADPETIAAEQFGIQREVFGERRAGYRRDLDDPRFNLSPVTDDMAITLHVSPEAGWPVLRDFLARDDGDQLTIGMYHMTAPHIVKALTKFVERPRTRLTLTLDRQRGDLAENPDDTGDGTKDKDVPERNTLAQFAGIAGDRFRWAPASLGDDGLFPTAYHIKVAVWSRRQRGDGVADKAVWLSSGNWQSSNQAPIERTAAQVDQVTWDEVADYNREWHALVEHAGLAATFRRHLEQDYADNKAAAAPETAGPRAPDVLVPAAWLERARRPSGFRPFPPKRIEGRIKVQPLLTPDNYPDVVAELISGARERVLIENQSFLLWKQIQSTPEHFLKLAGALRERQKAGLDVRIIIRSGFGNEREALRRLKEFKLKTDAGHVRWFDKCHTKGIVIDREIIVLGSQNWTAAGTGPNRDASLAIWHPEANAYFAGLFEHDWSQLAKHEVRSGTVNEMVRLVPAAAETPAAPGYRRISLAEFLGEG